MRVMNMMQCTRSIQCNYMSISTVVAMPNNKMETIHKIRLFAKSLKHMRENNATMQVLYMTNTVKHTQTEMRSMLINVQSTQERAH